MSDHYRTLSERAEFRHKIERSEFLGIAFPVVTDEEFFAELERTQKRYFDATHHCWAFRLFEGARSRSSDAGEPSGTAGKPILAAIEGAALHDLGVIVVRWYGGIKLGTGGLSRAYRDTAAETLRAASLLDRYVYQRIRVRVPFDALSHVYRLIDAPNVVLVDERYGEENDFFFDVRLSFVETFTKQLTERRLGYELAV
ncbi:MAG TPA: YigZ family protein [Thermoanaerobaculia bacterium]|nr:YigZ family protein [Thermoanaerobaculia bacterium]